MPGSTKPAVHGRDRQPDGPDAGFPGPWIYIGSGQYLHGPTGPDGGTGPKAPNFENGWANRGGADDVPMRYRILLGPPNLVGTTGGVQVVSEKSLEIEGDVTGGSNNTTVFTLPREHRLDYSKPMSSHDDAGAYVACRIYKDGRFVRGTP